MNNEYLNNVYWMSTIDGNKIVKMTYINDLPLKMKHAIRIYEDCGYANDQMVFVENKYGLWDCYVDSFFQSISNFESENIVLKNSTRQITHETNGDFGDRSQDIIRRIIKTKVSCSLKSLSFKDNMLHANWEVVEK